MRNLILTFVFSLVTTSIFAQVESERLGISRSAKVLEYGKSQLETGVTGYVIATDKLAYSIPDILFRRSLSNIHELQIQLPTFLSKNPNDSGELPLGNMSIGVKLSVISSPKANLSVNAKWGGLLYDPLTLAQSGGYLSLSAPLQLNFTERFYTRTEIIVNGLGGTMQRIAILAMGHQINEKISVLGEGRLIQYQSIGSVEPWNNRPSAGVACQYAAKENMLFDLGVATTFDSQLGFDIGEFYLINAGFTWNWTQLRKRKQPVLPPDVI